ncbi:MAG: hypothetical protein CSA97_05460 [Bacteroidetes bacterium]|nr:MAG: hypothetical protein CSA97_05460 [Bacteroidota bacterium]
MKTLGMLYYGLIMRYLPMDCSLIIYISPCWPMHLEGGQMRLIASTIQERTLIARIHYDLIASPFPTLEHSILEVGNIYNYLYTSIKTYWMKNACP